jgi:hypothetical protein
MNKEVEKCYLENKNERQKLGELGVIGGCCGGVCYHGGGGGAEQQKFGLLVT